jgi:hypothetical protein
MSEDARVLIASAVSNVLEEVPALKPLKLVVGFDMHGRGDTQMFRLELPAVTVTKDLATDARIRVDIQRAFFNTMVEHDAKVADWREAFMYGQAKATGNPQFLKLIATVVEKQEERNRLRRSRSG